MQINRVLLRTTQGGHNVPADDIRRRYERSLANAPKALLLADSGIVFDNSGFEPVPMFRLTEGRIIWEHQGVKPAWVTSLKLALTQSPSAPTGT